MQQTALRPQNCHHHHPRPACFGAGNREPHPPHMRGTKACWGANKAAATHALHAIPCACHGKEWGGVRATVPGPPAWIARHTLSRGPPACVLLGGVREDCALRCCCAVRAAKAGRSSALPTCHEPGTSALGHTYLAPHYWVVCGARAKYLTAEWAMARRDGRVPATAAAQRHCVLRPFCGALLLWACTEAYLFPCPFPCPRQVASRLPSTHPLPFLRTPSPIILTPVVPNLVSRPEH